MSASTVLTTRRLRLRHWRGGDANFYDRHCNTSDVMAWLGGVMTRRQLRADLAYFDRQQAFNGFTFWVLERKRDNAFLGFCGLVRVDEFKSTVLDEIEIGWRVRSDVWRRGYSYEAAAAVLSLGFERWKFDRVIARISPGNLASRNLALKLGMRRLPKLDYHHPTDGELLIVYEMTRRRWERQIGYRPHP